MLIGLILLFVLKLFPENVRGLYIYCNDAQVVNLYFYDITYADTYGITENYSFSYGFTRDSIFYREDQHMFSFPIAYLPFVYSNGHTYRLILDSFIIVDGVGEWQSGSPYEWTTSFSNDAIDWVSEHNTSFTNDDTINSNKVLEMLPSVNVDYAGQDVANYLFDIINNFFTSNEYEDIVILLPDGETEVTIRPNYIENKCPAILKNMIQAFYWFIICRYILIDIFKMIDSMRQGDYISGSNNNIKTEVL